MKKLALFGGDPIRTAPWLVEPMTGPEEEAIVIEAMREKSFSRYVGAATPDIEDALRMTSAEAIEIGDYWHFLGGKHVRAFAAEFAEKMQVRFAIPINAATTGLSVALTACGVEPGDEVIIPAISYTATGSAPLLFGAIPVFVDVDPESFCLDPTCLAEAITPRTKAILPVHLTGNMADMDTIRKIAAEHDVRVIEDAAQAIGAKWGNRYAGALGDAGVFSFQQSKNITTGEGGMIITDDPEIARRCRLILNHGEVIPDDNSEDDEIVGIIGCNFRMPELCAAMGRVQLKKLDVVNEWRTRNAEVLRKGLIGIRGLRIPEPQRLNPASPASDIPHLFVGLYDRSELGIPREVFVAALRAEGIPVGTGYARPMYANPTFLRKISIGTSGYPWSLFPEAGQNYQHGMAPVAERLLSEEFIWFYHIAYASTEDDMADIVRAVRKVVECHEQLKGIKGEELGPLAALGQGRTETSQRKTIA